jgi:hypothetical protein
MTGGRFLPLIALALLAGAAPACAKKRPAAPPSQAQPSPGGEAAVGSPAGEAAAIGAVTAVHGEVVWVGPDGARRPARIGPIGDSGRLVTGPGGQVVLVLEDGSRVELSENDEVAWARKGREVEVVPGRSLVLAHTPKGKGPRAFDVVVKTPHGVLRVPGEPVVVAVNVDRRRTLVDVRVGRIQVTDKRGKRIELRMGEKIEMELAGIEIIRSDGSRTKIGAEAAQAPAIEAEAQAQADAEAGGAAPAPAPASAEAATAPEAPVAVPAEQPPLPAPRRAPLVLAMTTDVRIYGDRLQEVTLTWPEGLPAARVEVARDHRFKEIVLAGRPEGDHINVTPPRHGSTYWRVLNQEGGELRRGKAKFVTDPRWESGGSRRAGATVSDSGVAAKLYYQSVAPAVTFEYTPHPKAARYRLSVARAGGAGKPLLERSLSQTRYTVEAGVLRDGEYVWKVTPVDASGTALGEAGDNRLTVSYDNAQVQLAIDKPRPWARVRGQRVQVQGVAPLESRLFVNGQRAPVDAKGRFDFQVQSAAALIFKVVSADGNETFWVRGLRAGS